MTSIIETRLPLQAGTWAIDQAHTGANFSVRHLGLSNVRGRFNQIEGTLEVGETLEDTSLEATIDLASVDTNHPDRDAHLRSTNFFSVDEHPKMKFQSTGISQSGDDYKLEGELTINGITKPISFDVEFNGTETGPDEKVHAGFAATGELRRNDFGIDFNMPVGVGNVVVGEKVKIELDVELIAP